ncbi:probable cytochrome P450 304a1 [Contarinia nasturtii]|uniref:probable cytochrome P450 304a1 n=1 Tax=Contarinia nasturtii TaxID=265458 RepID=UPI0012D3AD1B|nr:probable cytochrome P450 304a1 [Contarinia nasturtii]
MISFILINVCFLILVYNIYVYLFSRPHNFPPGPPKLPYFGSYIFMLLLDHKHLHLAVDRICKFYKTSVLGMHLGPFPTIVINGSENVKKMLNNRDFDGRPDILMGRMRHPEMDLHGIFFTENAIWYEQRRFVLRHLRDFGFGRRFDSLEKEIQIQIAQFIDIVQNGPKYPHEKKYVSGSKILMPYAISPVFGNCFIATLLNNETIPRESMDGLYRAMENAFIFQRKSDIYGKLYSIIPSFAKYFPGWSDYKIGRKCSMDLYNYFEQIINEQIQTFDESHERHFVDMYINKLRKQEPNINPTTHFSYSQLILMCIDLILPTLTTISSTITFLFQQIFQEPELQRKIQSEIDRVVGQGRFPTLDDRVNMPYTEACLREIMRFESLAPTGVPHKALVDTEFLGYTIPKGTIIMPALHTAMKENTVWEQPNDFRPERFLDASGKLCLSKDISLPFGAGKRLCAGETFARNMLFLFTTAFLQAFSVRVPNGEKPVKFSENITGTIRSPKDQWVELTKR